MPPRETGQPEHRPLKHWIRPQTVPRGFLRLYILDILSHGNESGYSMIMKIDDTTEGAWRPGAGTMYPLLRSLAKEGLVSTKAAGRGQGKKMYSLTPKGRRELERIRSTIAVVGSKERVLGKLFAQLLPSEVFVPIMVRRIREGFPTLQRRTAELPERDRIAVLEELRVILGSMLRWTDSELQ